MKQTAKLYPKHSQAEKQQWLFDGLLPVKLYKYYEKVRNTSGSQHRQVSAETTSWCIELGSNLCNL